MNLLRRAELLPADMPTAQSAPPVDPGMAEAEQLVAEMREAASAAGLRRDDPILPLLTALARGIRFLAVRTAGSDRVAAEASQRIADAIAHSRHAADAEAARFQAGLAQTEADTIQRIADGIARSADDALRLRIRVFDRNTALLAAGVLLASILAAGAGGYWWGRQDTLAGFHETERDLRAAFSAGPADAGLWRDLMTWNDIRRSLDLCNGQIRLQAGRKVCDVPLWVEPPVPAVLGPR